MGMERTFLTLRWAILCLLVAAVAYGALAGVRWSRPRLAGRTAEDWAHDLARPEPGVRIAAVDALGALAPDDPSATLARLEPALRDADAAVRLHTVRMIGYELPSLDGAQKALHFALHDGHTEVRLTAVDLLHPNPRGGPLPEPACARLKELLVDENARVRMHAMLKIEWFEEDPESRSRARCRGLLDPSPEVRRVAALGLVESEANPAAALRALVCTLDDGDRVVRGVARWVLRERIAASQTALAQLRELAEDRDPRVRNAASAILTNRTYPQND